MRISAKTLSIAAFLLSLCALVLTAGCKEDPDAKFADLMKQAESFRASERWDEARITLQRAIDIKNSDANAYYELAEVMMRLKNFGRARELYESAINRDPNHLQARLHLSAFLLAAHQTELAEGHISKLLEKEPENIEGKILQAGILATRRNFPEARKILEAVLQKQPNNAAATASLGEVALAEGNGAEAETLFRKSLELNPKNETIKLVLADLFSRQGRMEEAQATLETLVAANPKSNTLRSFLGEFLLLRGLGEKAAEQFQEMIKSDVGRNDARDRVYDFFVLKKDLAAARALTQELVAHDETGSATRYFQGRDLELEGKKEDALAMFLKAMEGLPSFAPVFRHAGVIEMQLGKTAEAIEHLNQALAADPNDIGSRWSLAQHYFTSRDVSQARDNVDKILRSFPKHLSANVLRADIALLEGDIASAERVYRALTQALPDNPVGYFKLGILEESKKNTVAAVENYRKALSFDREVTSTARRLALLIGRESGADKARGEIELLRDKSSRNKAAYTFLIGTLRLSKPNLSSEELTAARADFEKAIELEPDLLSAYFALGTLDSMTGDIDGAIRNYRTLIKNRPQHIPSRMLLALALERAKQPQEAANEYRELLKISPRFAPAANNLAWLLATELQGDLDEALKLALMAKEGLPTVSHVADTVGWIYYRRGSPRAALPFLEEALELEEKNSSGGNSAGRINPEILLHLAIVRAELVDLQGARKALERAAELGGEKMKQRADFVSLKQKLDF